ncbi:MAG: helix-turn-helix domain-containing protein, partial [Clostridia bacterium]|nr:helix-turn-helix domain-containing protein [Clostridia bacterium]
MSKQSTGEFLAILRKANGFTQQEVAEKLNISNRTLSSWETDRTTPDVYMLPAIADLYGVTVDELLRGERRESEKQTEISQSALHSARKMQFAKLSLRTIFLTSFASFGAVLFILAACLNLYTSSPVWLDALIAVLGGGGVIVCTILQIYFYFKAKYAGGIVLNEDLTDDKKSYVLAMKRKTQIYFLISTIPFLLFTVILGGVYCIEQPQNCYVTFEYVKGYLSNYEKVEITVYT